MLLETLEMAKTGDGAIEDMEFTSENLSGANFSHIELSFVKFIRCRFEDCDFSNAYFFACRFEKCDFSNCRFQKAYLKKTEIIGCRGDGADFTGAQLREVTMESTSMRYTNFSETAWDVITVRECILKEAFFPKTRFKKTFFSECDLSRTEFFGTPLKDMDFSDCDINGILVSDSLYELRGLTVNSAQTDIIAALTGVKIK